MSRAVVALGLGAALAACGGAAPVASGTGEPQPVVALIEVDTGRVDRTEQLMFDVQSLLLANPQWNARTQSHGVLQGNVYGVRFQGTCAGAADYVRAVEAQIARSAKVRARCFDQAEMLAEQRARERANTP